MNISDLFSAGRVEQFKSIEENLLNRKQNGKIAGTLALITAIGQALILLWPILKEILAGGGEVDLKSYFVSPFNYILLLFVVFFLVFYFIFRRTSFLLKATKEPFRYTFYVEEFQKIDTVTDGFELKKLDRLKLLSHDLTELINKRIKRFSILKDHPEKDDSKKQLTDSRKSSHVRIFGSYSVREDKENGDWIIHIMPYIQIGNLEAPSTLAQSVRFSLTTDETPDVLDTREYNQLLERVYSRVTTEIYARIKQDIDAKIKLFPTSFLQENALFQEAQDMAASNTINAFDSAIGLYEKAMKKSASSFRINFFNLLFKIAPLRAWLIQFLHHYARIRIGHSLCLIYKKRIATLSGRSSSPIFEIRQNLKRVISLLELVIFAAARNRESRDFSDDQKTFFNLAYLSYPADNWPRKLLFRTSKKTFDATREILFNAYVVHALSDTLLNSFIAAREKLDKARSLAPDLSNESVLFMLAEGYVEPNIDKAILLFR